MKKTALFFPMILFFLVSTGLPLDALTFDEVLLTIDNTYELQSAMLEVDRLEAEARAAASPEDLRFAFNPAVRFTSEVDGDFPGETGLTGYTSLSIPISLSGQEKDRLNTVRNNISVARSMVAETYAASYIRLFSLYQDLWLLQQEAEVLEAEVGASELYMELMQERFNTGATPLSTLTQVEETMIERQEALIRNRLEQRLSWFELSLHTGIDEALPLLEALVLPSKELPKPPEMEDWIIENHPLIIRSRLGIEQLRQDLRRMKAADYDLSIKPFWNYQDHSVSLAYNLVDPEITAGYNFPIFTWDEIPSGSGPSVDTWNTGVSFNFSIGTNRNDTLGAAALELSIKEKEAGHDYLIQSILLRVRSSYQQLLRSRELLEQAKRNLERSIDNRKIVDAKRELDQAPRHEVLEASANEARARWKVREAQIDNEKAYLNLLKEAALFEEKI